MNQANNRVPFWHLLMYWSALALAMDHLGQPRLNQMNPGSLVFWLSGFNRPVMLECFVSFVKDGSSA